MVDSIVRDVPSLIEAAGGLAKAGRMVGMTTAAVWAARRRGALPSRMYLVQLNALARHGITAAPSLWAIEDPATYRPDAAA